VSDTSPSAASASTAPAAGNPAATQPQTREAALAEIETLKSDKVWYQQLRAGSVEAKERWNALQKVAFAPPVITSPEDVAAQEAGRREDAMNSYVAGLKTQWSVTPENEKEIRAGVIREQERNWALEEKARLIKDRAFYRKLLDGDREAKDRWGRVVAMISLKPVK
jgi:hypothetical protein